MKKEIIICDICGKPIDYYKDHRKFKVRMKELHYARDLYEIMDRWHKMDVHDECFQELGRLICLTREQKKRDIDKMLENINAFAELVNKS